ncbi:50S ribosomal protein L9 [Mesomycoplasma neurolyticum]|uniref:Large ribosomal subunit protein bL9 n=1 Tax=Mesomycoplasma neurolyticum TaxID=2120 RepID=A0A449A6C2_9BACT|nr:50S ribosomal protein L9 [Mesomycoplasma neurolyticum]VEU59778.1 50S ribosomal protein L9 [Mesomycoplasma neurolyticum]
MKVIIIKEFNKDYKLNQVVEVSDGYAKNFLIKNGYALPVNKTTTLFLEKRIEEENNKIKQKVEEAKQLAEKINNTIIEFKLKAHNDVPHNSITAKKIHKKLEELNIKLPKHTLEEHIHINSFGLRSLNIKLHKDVIAHLRIKVIKQDV